MKLIAIENKSGKVKLNETVTPQSVQRIIEEVGRLFGASAVTNGADFGEIMNSAENAVDVLVIEINSPGGSVFDGYTLFHEIKSLRDRGVVVNAVITGMAASMGSVICMACDKVTIVPHGRLMIHDASATSGGNAEQLRKTADLLDGISQNIAEIYSEKTGKSIDEIRDLMKKETWMNADQSLENGFVDEIAKLPSVETTASLNTDQIVENMNFFLSSKAATEKISGLEARIEELEGEVAPIETLKAEAITASETIANLTSDLVEASGKVVAFEATIESLTTELTEASGKVVAFEETIASLTTERDEASGKIVAFEATIAEQESTINSANEILATFDEKIENGIQLGIANLGFKGSVPASSEEAGNTVSLREKINAIQDPKKRQEARLKNWGKI